MESTENKLVPAKITVTWTQLEPGPLRMDVCEEYKKETGHDVMEDFPLWEPCHRAILGNGIMGWENVGGDIDKVTGKRVTIAGFPIRWEKGDGSIVRLVAMVEE